MSKRLFAIAFALVFAVNSWAANRYLQSAQNMSTLTVYDAASGGSVSTLDDGDDLVPNGYILTLDAAALPASGTLNSIQDPGKAGYLVVPLDTTGNCEIRALSITCGTTVSTGFVQVTGATSNTLTLYGNITAGTVSNAWGAYINTTGNVNVIGNIASTGGTNRYALVVGASATVGIVGNLVVANGPAIYVNGGSPTVTITGNGTASATGAASCINVGSSGTVIVMNGALSAGAGAGAHGLYSAVLDDGLTITLNGTLTGGSGARSCGISCGNAQTIILTGNVIDGTGGPAVLCPRPVTWTHDGSKYWQNSNAGTPTKYGKIPTAGQLASGVVCGDVTGTLVSPDLDQVTEAGGGSYHEPEASEVQSGVTFGPASAYTGTLAGETHSSNQVISSAGGNYVEASAGDVWYEVPFGVGLYGTKRASSIANCTATNVRRGVVVDNVTGTYAGPRGVGR